jgi:Fe-S cluster assembly ATP-binding protein
MADLKITDLTVEVDGTPILKGVDLEVKSGETVALMGPNGSGKSTLAYAIAGHPAYDITGGDITLDGRSILDDIADERARAGLFLAMQYPVEVPGVSVTNFLRTAVNARREEDVPVRQFMTELKQQMAELGVDEAFLQRSVNEGFSGGEKKRFEILQMAMLKPVFAVLDETDSGLDIDALRIVAEGVNRIATDDMGTLLVTHYSRILNYITPDRIVVMADGVIAAEGGPDLAEQLEETGYDEILASA